MILRARYVVPVEEPPIENGAIVLKDGRIESVGHRSAISGEPVRDYGEAVILPGFVNAHTHLELSDLGGRVPPSSDFVAWLAELVSTRTKEPVTRVALQATVSRGLIESLRSGTTAIGDITSMPAWTRETLSASPLRGVSFGEVIAIGTRRGLLEKRLMAAASTEHETASLKCGISPHAPYTVEPDGLRVCADRANSKGLPICIHLCETSDESAFTQSGSGPFAQYLRELQVWDESIPASGFGPVELALRTGILGPRTLLAHANYVTDVDIRCIAETGSSVVYCPRTHHAFGHPPHRFREMPKAGINVCIGTDSLASNPSLSVLDEMRFLRRQHPDLSASEILELGTIRGAKALGIGDEIGSIAPGKQADLVVVPLVGNTGNGNWGSVFDIDTDPQEVYISGEALTID